MYIPYNKKNEYENLQQLLKGFRKPTPSDSNTMHPCACIVRVIGSGKNSVYKDFLLTRCDFASVTDKVATYAYAVNLKGERRIVPTKSLLSAGRVWILK